MKKNLHVFLAIIVIPLVNFSAPMFPFLYGNMMRIVIALAVVFAVLAAINKARFDVLLALTVAAAFAGSRWFFPQVDERTLALRTSAILSFTFLNFVLLIGPWSRFSEAIRRIYRHRRHLGVTTYLLAQLHFTLVFSNYFQNSFANAFMALFTFFGFTAYFIMLALALTSWDWMQKHVGNKKWKRIHLSVFVAYFAIAGYAFWVNVSNNLPIEPWQWTAVATFAVLWYLMAPWGLAPKLISNLMGWKQLHTLVHIAYLSVVLHVWFGVAIAQPPWVQITFWSLVVLTWGSHAAGWLIKWKEDKALKDVASQAKQIMVEGKAYWSVGRAEEWEEGNGRKILVQNNPIAVFRYREKFFGLYAICAHQKGPIHQGKIVNGYVECPWHGWQYSCETGLGPPGFSDKLSFFPCVVQGGIVYVSALPRRATAG